MNKGRPNLRSCCGDRGREILIIRRRIEYGKNIYGRFFLLKHFLFASNKSCGARGIFAFCNFSSCAKSAVRKARYIGCTPHQSRVCILNLQNQHQSANLINRQSSVIGRRSERGFCPISLDICKNSF